MIRLVAGELTLRDAAGATLAYSLDALLDDLWAGCAAAGITDPDLPQDLLETLRAYTVQRAGQPLTATDLDAVVARMLHDCGLHAVARHFRARRELPDGPPPGALVPAEAAALARVLAGDYWFACRPVDALAGQVAQRLALIGLRQATPALVCELARHLWDQPPVAPAADDGPLPPGAVAGYWLLPRAELMALLTAPEAALTQAGALAIKPVSHLLPKVDLTLTCARLTDDLQPCPEILLLPRVDDACRLAAGALGRVLERVAQRLPPASGPVAGQVLLPGLRDLPRLACGLRTAPAAALARELAALAQHHFSRFPQVQVKVE